MSIIQLQLQLRFHALSDSYNVGTRVNVIGFEDLNPHYDVLLAKNVEILPFDPVDPLAVARGLLAESSPRWLREVCKHHPF